MSLVADAQERNEILDGCELVALRARMQTQITDEQERIYYQLLEEPVIVCDPRRLHEIIFGV